ncbi:protein of unknown function DUF1295 [Kipferlia bialata]|uniref:Steroid 5-alpha reductase C-terminal domain-containing protein n=1 Tax=Kipferlia bialata TaxID=797122 RepID=A0A9K3CT94_9EUKA|nr:protein of unknown function DUF1295 [Kipferlia bialata]|eukprot:g3673.t1
MSSAKQWLSIAAVALAGVCLSLTGSVGSVTVTLFTHPVPLYALCGVFIYAVQIVAFVPAWILNTEMFFDLTGFDVRFNEFKKSLPKFLLTWVIQGMWVQFTLAAVLRSLCSSVEPPTSTLATVAYGVGLSLWLVGFGLEALADRQKRQFRADPSNKGHFISSGLWSVSRHPKYCGEITLWFGLAIACTPMLGGSGWVPYLTLVSPVFVYTLITRVSGVPLLEKSAEERWGASDEYQAYKARTRTLLVWPRRRQRDTNTESDDGQRERQ